MANNSYNSSCLFWPHNPDRCDTVSIIQKLCPSLSIVGCFIIILIIWLFKKYKVFVQRIILALCISALFQSIIALIGSTEASDNDFVCRATAFSLVYFSWSTLSWVIVITINMLFIMQGRQIKHLEVKYHLFVWFNSLIWACIPVYKNSYGPAGIWCWIQRDRSYFRFGVWYIPLFIVCIWMLCVYGYIFFQTRRLAKTATGTLGLSLRKYRKEVKPLLMYPLLYLVLTVPVFVYRLNDAFYPDAAPIFSLILATVLTAPSVGSCMALVYAFHNESLHAVTWEKMKSAFSTRFGTKPYNIRPYSVSSYRGSLRSRLSTKKSKRSTTQPSENLEHFNGSFHAMQTKPDDTILTPQE